MPRYFLQKHLRILKLSRAHYMHSDAASQGGGWWQGCGATYPNHTPMIQQSGIRTYARSCAWPVHCSDITPASWVSTKLRIASLEHPPSQKMLQ